MHVDPLIVGLATAVVAVLGAIGAYLHHRINLEGKREQRQAPTGGELTMRVVAIEASVVAIEARVVAIEARVEGMDELIAAHGRLDTLLREHMAKEENDQREHIQALGAIREAVAVLKDRSDRKERQTRL